jgi:hypothetical protein
VFPEVLSVGDEASRLLGEKHGDLFKGVLCEVGYRLRRFPPLNRSFADAEDLRRLDLRHAGHINRATLSGESCSRHGPSIRRLRGEFNGPKGIFLNAHGDPTPGDADRPAKEGAASGHLRPWKRKSGDCGQSWSRSSHNAGYFSVCYRSSAGAVAMIRTGLFLRTIAGVVMLSASSGSLRAQAYEGEAEVSTPSAEPMKIMPLELGPPLPPLPPPMAPHFAVTTHVAAGARMLVEIELLGTV